MNLNEYILSGIVEAYVLGLADAGERKEFEEMCQRHPEVLAAREAFEIQLEQFSLANAVPPPAELREQLLQNAAIAGVNAAIPPDSTIRNTREGGAETRGARVLNWSRWVAAASLLLLIASTVLNFYFFSQYKQFSRKYDDLLARNTELATREQNLQTTLKSYENIIANPGMNRVKLAGANVPASPAPASLATLYWDKQSKELFLLVNNLPVPAAGRQYQLWAIVNGKPVDAGVFDILPGLALQKMKTIPEAQAFAVTLEKAGGSPTPTLSEMYVMGTPASG